MNENERKKIISLNSKYLPEISEVGGKGYSLIKLYSLNLTVPNGIILTVDFFMIGLKQSKTQIYTKNF